MPLTFEDLQGVPPKASAPPPYYQRTRDDIAISDQILDAQRATSSSNNYGMADFDSQVVGQWVPAGDAYAKAERAALSAIERKLIHPVSELSYEETKKRISRLMLASSISLEIPVGPEPTWNERGSFDDDAVERLARNLAAELGLVGFEEYALRQAEENRRRGVKDAARRTGRTWSGLIRALARCRLERAEVLSIHGGTRASTEAVKMTATRLAKRLDERGTSKYPSLITTLGTGPVKLAEEGGQDILGRRVVVYRDHYQGEAAR